MRVRLRFLLSLFTLLVVGLPAAQAHFQLNINIRVIHVEHLADGLRVYLRLPTPYVLAPLIGARRPDGSVPPAPYSRNQVEKGQLMHYIDTEALRADPMGLGHLAAAGHSLTVEGTRLAAEVQAVRLHTGLTQPPFATLEEAEAALQGPVFPADAPETFVGDTVLDVLLVYRTGGTVTDYEMGSSLDPGLKGQEETANLLIDHYPGESLVFRERGLLATPVAVSRSPLAAAGTFVIEGIRHILEGTDHVLFVLCLIIGARHIAGLLWRVTGFTLGHTMTLILGFFGYVPAAPWFVPAVETGIAASIAYAAAIAVAKRPPGGAFAVTAGIGLLHGLGFSFVLQEILRVDSPNLWQSLLAFNLGVEVGQVAIVLLVWPALWLLARRSERLGNGLRWAVAVPCVAVAAFWISERGRMVLESL